MKKYIGSGEYIPSLDGMRGISIILVVISHLGFGNWVPGGLGVTIFFFISGFIITRLLISELNSDNHVNLKAFYVRRLFRLAPALLMYVLIANLAFLMLGRAIPLEDSMATVFYLANYWHIYHGWGGTTVENTYSPLGIVWSLAVEEHFYLFFPALVLVFKDRLKNLGRIIVFICILVLLWRCYIIYTQDVISFESVRTYKATDTRIDSILFGCLLSIWVASSTANIKNSFSWVIRALGSAGWIIAGSVLLLLTLLLRTPEFRETIRYTIQGLALLAIFYGLYVSGQSGVIKKVLEARVLVWVGKISYSLYLYHWLVIVVLKDFETFSSLSMLWIVGLPLMLILSYASYSLLEIPLRRYGHALSVKIRSNQLTNHGN